MTETKAKAAPPSIQSKLLEFQKLNISIKKGKTNPHFKNKYADINEVLDKVKPALSQLGVVLYQVPEQDGLRTFLHDTESGTQIEGYLEFSQKSDAQKLGSNITYYRRYSLVAMLGLEDDDNDGTEATKKAVAAPALTLDQAFKKLKAATTVADLETTFKSFPADMKKDDEVIAMAKEVKAAIINLEVTS